MKIGFDSEKYMQIQSKHILERIDNFGGKLYLEFGGKLFDDLHASRVLPGFDENAKIKLLQKLKDKCEIIFCISASDNPRGLRHHLRRGNFAAYRRDDFNENQGQQHRYHKV